MTPKAIALGFLGAAAVCGFTYFNDAVMHQTMFVGNNMPLSVYGGVILFVLFVNPLLLLAERRRSPLGAGLVAGLFGGAATGAMAGLVAGLQAGTAAGIVTGLVAGVLAGFGAGSFAALVPRPMNGVLGAAVGAASAGIATGLAAGVLPGVLVGLFAALVSGLAAGRVALSGRELAVVLALTLAACCIPGSGLLRTFTSGLMMPRHFNRTETGWKENRVTEMLPPQMLAGAEPFVDEEDILDPRGLCLRLTEGGTTARSSPPRRIWALLPEEDRAAVRRAGERALTGPGEDERGRARAAVSEVLDEELERARHEEKKRRKAEAAGKGIAEKRRYRLTEAGRDVVTNAVRDALVTPRRESPATAETVRVLRAAARLAGVSDEGADDLAAAVLEAFEPFEAPCRAAAARALNGLLDRPDFYNPYDFAEVTLPEDAAVLLKRRAGTPALGSEAAVPPEELSRETARRLNRHLIDSSFPKGTMLTLVAKQDKVLNGFVQGLTVGEQHIGLSEIPWGAWRRALRFWLPLILVLWIGLMALSVVVHQQWARHEQLPYPIAAFADSLLPGPGRAMGDVFRDRLFWLGVAGVLFVHMNNYAYTWNPELVKIPTSFDASSLQELFPTIRKGGGWFAFWPRIYFTVVAFAYFLATDVSLSLGIGPYVYCWIVGMLVSYGVAVGGGSYLAPNYQRMQLFGAYLGILVTLVYTGRHYYINVFRRAVFLRSRDEIRAEAIWGARVFLLALFGFIANLTLAGLDWQLSTLYALGVVTIFLVMARIAAETGLFFIQPYWAPCLILVGLLGPGALGPRTMLFMAVVTTVLLIDPRESLMPFMVNSLKVLDLKGVRIGRTAGLCAAAIVVGLAVGLTVTLYFQYDRGANMDDKWANDAVPKFAFNEAVRAKDRLTAQGSLPEAGQASRGRDNGSVRTARGFGRLRYVTTEPGMILAFGVGLVLVLAFMMARWRLPRWPLHPVMFLVWSTYPGACFAFSFFLGWLVKAVVVKYGGESVFRKLKPLMFGLIAGDMLGGMIPTIIGVLYYLFTDGVLPKSFNVMPG